MEHIWTMLMHKTLQNHLLCAFAASLKIGVIYTLYPESFCDKNLAIRKVFAFCDSGGVEVLRQKLHYQYQSIFSLVWFTYLRCNRTRNRKLTFRIYLNTDILGIQGSLSLQCSNTCHALLCKRWGRQVFQVNHQWFQPTLEWGLRMVAD